MNGRSFGCGCFSRNSDAEEASGLIGSSSEQRIRIAARILPSSSFDATALARSPLGGGRTCCPDGMFVANIIGPDSTLQNSDLNNSTLFLMVAERLCLFPPLTGGSRIDSPKWRRVIQ